MVIHHNRHIILQIYWYRSLNKATIKKEIVDKDDKSNHKAQTCFNPFAMNWDNIRKSGTKEKANFEEMEGRHWLTNYFQLRYTCSIQGLRIESVPFSSFSKTSVLVLAGFGETKFPLVLRCSPRLWGFLDSASSVRPNVLFFHWVLSCAVLEDFNFEACFHSLCLCSLSFMFLLLIILRSQDNFVLNTGW